MQHARKMSGIAAARKPSQMSRQKDRSLFEGVRAAQTTERLWKRAWMSQQVAGRFMPERPGFRRP
jgi:hypothetical protein